VQSNLSVTQQQNGFIPSVSLDRFQTFASSSNWDQARILHLPSLRYDVLDRPLSASPAYWGLASSIAYMNRSEPHFHARNAGRFDFYPHISLPFGSGGWSVVPEAALRDTFYSISQVPDLTGANTMRSTVSMRRPRSIFAHRPWSATLRSTVGTGNCATSSSLS
jgi:LPS-assembly protein